VRSVDVLIAGGGFGGAFCAHRLERHLRGRSERVLLVSAESFLLFSPLLPEAASGTVEPRHCVVPLRSMLPGTDHLVGRVGSISFENRTAVVEDINGERLDISWRELVLAPGSVPALAPIPGLAEEAVGFKTLADGIWLRNRVLRQLEAADATDDRGGRRRLLTFTFVGGGYAGVEALARAERGHGAGLRTPSRGLRGLVDGEDLPPHDAPRARPKGPPRGGLDLRPGISPGRGPARVPPGEAPDMTSDLLV